MLSPLLISAAKAKEPKATTATPPGMDAATQAAMADMMKFATPGPMHELLKSLAGNWNTSNKSWYGPGDPVLSTGTCKREMILGGRFLKSTYQGTMMDQPFEGMEILGFDQRQNQFVSVWVDNMGTGIMMSNGGKADPTGKVLTVNMNMDDPVSKKSIPYKMVTKIVDANKHTFSMIGVHEGKETTEMEITYTRAN